MKEINKLLERFRDWFYKKYVRPVKKAYRRRKFEREEKLMRIAMGKIMEMFVPLLIRIFDEAVRDYDTSMQASFKSREVTRDLRKFYELKIKEFTSSVK